MESVPYRLFTECLLGNLDKTWSVLELARTLKTSIPTIYRHLDKLSALDLLGQSTLEGDVSRKGYHIRYHDFSQAWRFTEVNVELSLEVYRKVVDAVQAGIAKKETGPESKRELKAEGDFALRVVDYRFGFGEKWESLAGEFLFAVDYLSDMGTFDLKKAKASIPYRLLVDCLLRRPEPGWTMDELSAHLDTTKPTVYRYLRKLGRLGVLEKSVPDEEAESSGGGTPGSGGKAPPKRQFRIRRGNLSKAWNASEWYARSVMKSYRRTVEHLAGFGKK
jgi:predicted transcriptional regulator